MLRITRTAADMQRLALRLRAEGSSIGLAPTMGCLHEGHLSLMRAARRECDALVVSIFVNPLQFGPREDLASYPRSLAADLVQLMDAPADVAFVPGPGELYPEAFTTSVEVTGITEGLCGVHRPGHFRGVATVVCKLFNLVQPTRAYFGEKDYQQLQVIRRMVANLNMPVEIIGLPIVREADGLAMSSRNRYLSADERRAATCLSRSLKRARNAVEGGEREAARVRQIIMQTLDAEPLLKAEYVALCDAETLEPVTILDGPTLIALAVHLGNVRLIDNVIVCPA